MVFLVMSWFLSTETEKITPLKQNTEDRRQWSVVIGQKAEVGSQNTEDRIQKIVYSQQKIEEKQLPKGKTSKLRKTSKDSRKVDKKPDSTFLPVSQTVPIRGIPTEREKTWQLKERRVALGPQAIVKISIEEEPLPLRGGLGVSAPKEVKRYEVSPPDVFLKKE